MTQPPNWSNISKAATCTDTTMGKKRFQGEFRGRFYWYEQEGGELNALITYELDQFGQVWHNETYALKKTNFFN